MADEPPFNSRGMVALGGAVVLANLLAAYASVIGGMWGLLPANAFGAGMGVWVTVTWVQRERRRHA